MRKAIRWVVSVVSGLIGILLLIFVGVVIWGELTFKRTLERPIYEISADMSTAGIARGEYLVRSVMACGDCHSDDSLTSDLSGRVEPVAMGPISGLFAAPNLTSHETGLGQWTDAEIARAIREGVDKDGRELLIMPSFNYREMSDEDTAAVIGFLRSIEPVSSAMPEMEINWAGKALLAIGMFPKAVTPVVDTPIYTPAKSSLEYGRYLVALGGCRDCHGVNLDGIETMNPVPGLAPAPNISGSGYLDTWTEAQFVQSMRAGVTPAGAKMSDDMPWRVYAGMTDEDLAMIFRYLSTMNTQSASQ